MKILIINYRYFVSGGPERYMFNLMELLNSKGHTVIPFSIKYTKNEASDYTRYFTSPITNEDEVLYRDQKLSIKTLLRSISRSIYSKEVYRDLNSLISDYKPDFAIVLHYLRKLSPSVLTVLSNNKVPFIVRISDFAMICPNSHLLRDERVCDKCIKHSWLNSVKYRCVQNSLSASFLNYFAMQLHYRLGTFEKIKLFAIPSKFTISKMIEAGWPNGKLILL